MKECPVCDGTGYGLTNNPPAKCGYCRGTGLWDNRPHIAAGPGFVMVDGIDAIPADIAERFGKLAKALAQ